MCAHVPLAVMKQRGFGEVPTLTPSFNEFQNFEQYLQKIAPIGQRYGLVKVVPPPGWSPRKASYDDIDITIPVPIQQEVHGSHGCFQAMNIERPSINVKEFNKVATGIEKKERLDSVSFDDLERKFWKNIQFCPPLYGADMVGSLTDENVTQWNCRCLPTILRLITVPMEGINIPYLYFGMWKAMFAWHTEGGFKVF